jgi:hypothetical protein
MTTRAISLTGAMVVLVVGLVQAHHPVANYFDTSKTVTLEGTVAATRFAMPHSYLLVDVKDETGNVQRWVVEGGDSKSVVAAGMTPKTVSIGAAVTIVAFPPKSGVNLASVLTSAPEDVAAAFKAGRLVHGKEIVLTDGTRIAFTAA